MTKFEKWWHQDLICHAYPPFREVDKWIIEKRQEGNTITINDDFRKYEVLENGDTSYCTRLEIGIPNIALATEFRLLFSEFKVVVS